jgi:hypothetical protein
MTGVRTPAPYSYIAIVLPIELSSRDNEKLSFNNIKTEKREMICAAPS